MHIHKSICSGPLQRSNIQNLILRSTSVIHTTNTYRRKIKNLSTNNIDIQKPTQHQNNIPAICYIHMILLYFA